MIDTGAARGSIGGKRQFFAYCKAMGQKPVIEDTRAANCHFGIGTTISSGVGNIVFPVGKLWMSFDLHAVDAETPILLSIDDMDRLGCFVQNLDNVLVHRDSGETAEITCVKGHPYLQWNTEIISYLTFPELKQLHRRFGHPHVDKLVNVLERSEMSTITSETRKTLEKIERSCATCQEYAQRPRWFKFTFRDDIEFNYNIYVDIFYIEGKPVLHVVDEGTRFQAVRWLPNVSSEYLWKALRQCWINVYLGPPDVMVHDAGKNFMGNAFAGNADMLHIVTKSVPFEAANSMSIVERYHAPFHRSFNIIKKEAPDVENDYALQLAVKAISDSISLDSLIPTLLVFGALPRLGLPTDQPTPSTFKRAVALRKATEEMSRHFAKRQVRDVKSARNGPVVTDIHHTAIGSPVLVYRPEKDKWDGPFSLLDINGENCIVLLPHPAGPSKFKSTVVKPFIAEPPNTDIYDVTEGNFDALSSHVASLSCYSNFVRVSLVTSPTTTTTTDDVYAWKQELQQSDDDDCYKDFRSAEFNGLLEKASSPSSISRKPTVIEFTVYDSAAISNMREHRLHKQSQD